MKNLYFLGIFACVLSFSSFAQFSKAYAPSKWTTTKSAPPAGTINNASVNTSSAPGSITITGSNDPNDPVNVDNVGYRMDIDYTITAIAPGEWSFHWVYHSNDSYNDPQYDIVGVLKNGAFTQLSSTAGAVDQSNDYRTSVNAGDIIGFRIRAVDNSYGNATLTISSFSPPGGILPVTLSGFDAQVQGAKVLVQWKAATEINTSHYMIERSGNGTGFSPVGRVEAGALSQQYSFTDELPLPGTNYYRLQMVDKDGSFSYSPIASVLLATTASRPLYPNPAANAVTVSIKAAKAGTETLELFNAVGSLVRKETIVVAQGHNQKQLQIASLPGGSYFIKAATAGWVQWFVKE